MRLFEVLEVDGQTLEATTLSTVVERTEVEETGTLAQAGAVVENRLKKTKKKKETNVSTEPCII